MTALRTSEEYEKGVEEFIDFSKRHATAKDNKYFCPCVNCLNGCLLSVSDIRDHLICDGINLRYRKWIWHGETYSTPMLKENEDVNGVEDNIHGMIHDVGMEFFGQPHISDTFKTHAETPLYPGCTSHTLLTAVLKLFNLKTRHGWTEKSFSELLQLLNALLPEDNVVPRSTYEAKKLLSDLGMGYEKIHACPNDCILYREEYFSLTECPKCGIPRYKLKKNANTEDEKNNKGQPLKVMWYLPIIPRLKRMFGNASDAKRLQWHSEERVCDARYLQHPADSPQWKKIDFMFPEFGLEPRNIRLGLCTDGINPFGTLSSTHSSWPVLLVIYNLPPSLCMKRKYMMLSMIISGPKQPGNDIDVYLTPLIDDLKKLWGEGVAVYDAYKDEIFTLRAMIFTTINDFPAYGNLSGYIVKGHKACPICQEDTNFYQLQHGRKTVYLGHRRFLDRHHPYRRLKKNFNGLAETGAPPTILTGEQVYNEVERLDRSYGKGQNIVRMKNIWKKRSIFFDLPYWRCLDVRHSLDIMHVEKNLCDSLVSTLLHIPGKSKDGITARMDLVEMGIRHRLHPHTKDDGKRVYMEPATHTLSKGEKLSFCQCLEGIKVPQGYCSKVANFVSTRDLKLSGMKSHDYHVLMQQLLPIAIRGIMKDDVRGTITRLSLFFNSICKKVVDIKELDELEKEGYVILCQLEMHFPPAFFDIMTHLVVHLVREIRLCGPVYFRWMYPFERYMKILKGYSKNPYRPEASIVERYVIEEAMTCCSSYLSGVTTQSRHEEGSSKGTQGLKVRRKCPKELLQAHLYVLNNMDEVQPYLELHKKELNDMYPKKNDMQIAKEHNKSFVPWFKKKVMDEVEVSKTLKWLAWGPFENVTTWSGYDINGFSFYTKDQDGKSTVQNSGVMVVAEAMHFSSSKDKNPRLESMSYYGVIEEMWDISYTKFNIPVFKCLWVDNTGVHTDDKFGFTLVELDRVGHTTEPFILASQAKQVFYVTDPSNEKLSFVLQGKKQKETEVTLNLDDTLLLSNNPPTRNNEAVVDDDNFAARDDHAEGLWVNT